MATELGSSGQVPPQPTIRRVFSMMKAYLNEFERQTLNGFKTLREQYQERDKKMSSEISAAMDSYDKDSTPAERKNVEEKLQILLSHRASFRAEHNQGKEEEACEKRQLELLRPLQIALFHSFPIGSWDAIMLHGPPKVLEDTDRKEQPPDVVIQHATEETQYEFETVKGAGANGSALREGAMGGIDDEEGCDEVPGPIAQSNKARPDAEPSHHSSRQPEDSGRGSYDLDSEFEPEIEEESEEGDDESALGVRIDEDVAVSGSKRKLPYASRSQPRKKPCQREKSPIKCQSKERTVRFKEVYENTRAGRKEIIVQFPANNGRWYIIRCEEHGIEFGGTNPLMDAAFHLGSLKHDKYSKAYKDVIEKMGIRVKYCTKSRAEQNNNAITNKVVQKNSPPSMDWTTASSRNTEDTLCDDIEPVMSDCDSDNDNDNEGNGNPYVRRQPGEICLVYHCGEHIPVLVLPLEDMFEIGINGDLETLNLVQSMPDCCVYKLGTGRYGWKDGYEDGGRFESLRAHPGLCLTHNTLEMCGSLWVKGTDLGEFDLRDPAMVKQEYYQPLLRLILQLDANRAANKASLVTDPGNQHLSSSGHAADGVDGESCASPRVPGVRIQPDNVSKQGDDVKDGPEDGCRSQTDRQENQEDDTMVSDDENVQNDDPSGSIGMSSPSLQQDRNYVSEPQQGIDGSIDHSPGPEESHSPSQQPASNATAAVPDDRTIKESSINCTTTAPNKATIRESYTRHAVSGDEPTLLPSTETRSRSPPPKIGRAASVQTISSDSGGSDDFGNVPETQAASDQPSPRQQIKLENAVYESPPVGTRYDRPAMVNIEGPQQVSNGSWPSTCRGKGTSLPGNNSATTQTQFIDLTNSPIEDCSCSTLGTNKETLHIQRHQDGERRVYQTIPQEVANNTPNGFSTSQGHQSQSQIPSQARVEVPACCTSQAGHALHQAQMPYQTQTGSYVPPHPEIQHPPYHSQLRDQSQSQFGIQFQAHNQPRRSMPAQYHAQPQTHPQPQFPNQTRPGPQNSLHSPIQTQLLAGPQSQVHTQSPTQPFSQVPPQPQGAPASRPQGVPQSQVLPQLQGLPRPLQGLHVVSEANTQTQIQSQIQPQSQVWAQTPTIAVPKSNSYPPIRARRTPIIQLRPPQSRQTQGQPRTSPTSNGGSPTSTPKKGGQTSPEVLLTPRGSGPYISPPFSATSTSPTTPAIGGFSSPEDVRELLGPPKQTALPCMYVNPPVNSTARSVAESEADRALQKNWPMFPRGPLRDYLDAYVRMNHRAPGIEGLRLVGGRSVYFCPFCLTSTAQWTSGLELINHLDSMHRTGQFRPLNTR